MQRSWLFLLLVMVLSGTLIFGIGCADDDGDGDPDGGTDCGDDPCDTNAKCVLTDGTAACECNPGYEGDGTTCTDIDECATANGGCDDNATCTNTDGHRNCTCNEGYIGDGDTCSPFVDESLAGCAVMQAEHPGYTNIARDVVLCGSLYTAANITTACATGWHVCLEEEWLARYPTDRPYGLTDPDPTLATLGQYTSWGASQAFRCYGGVWISDAPDVLTPYDDSVCYFPGGTIDDYAGADYLPQNDGKFLFDDDGTTIMEGRNSSGEQDCCTWDVTWAATSIDTGFAVYCCRN